MANGDDHSDKRIFSFRLHRHSPTERTALEFLLTEMDRGKSIREIVSLALYQVATGETYASEEVLRNQQTILAKLKQLEQTGIAIGANGNQAGQGEPGGELREDPNDPMVMRMTGFNINNI